MFTDPEVTRFIGPRRPMTDNEIEDWFAKQLAIGAADPARSAVLASGEFAGICGVQYVSGKADFGYFFRRKYWGTGVPTRACAELYAAAYARYGRELHTFIADANVASVKLARRIGLACFEHHISDEEKGCLYYPSPKAIQNNMSVDTWLASSVRRSWLDILGRDQLEKPDGDFFENGGSSLSALRLHIALQRSLGTSVSFAELMRKPTVHGMAAAIWEQGRGLLIEYRPGTQLSSIVVFVHPAGAGPEVYRRIIESLPASLTVVGINNPFLVSDISCSLHELAKWYLAELLERYGLTRSFRLCGWSLGGIIAAELAVQLERSRAKVDHLILVDAFLPTPAQVLYLRALNRERRNEMLRADLVEMGLPFDSIERVLASRDAEERIFIGRLSGTLAGSRLTLVAAGRHDSRCGSEMERALQSLKDTGEQTLGIAEANFRSRLVFEERHHNDILDEAEHIAVLIENSGEPA